MSSNQQPLNIRNNNPGNLRFVGQEGATQGEGGFARFETPQAGLDAMRAQIELDTQTRGMNLTQFLNKYAPPSENKTSNYIDYVARKTGLDPTAPVPTSAIPQLQLAMIEMEGGPRSVSYFTKTAASATPVQETRTTVQGPKQIGARVAGMFEPGSLPTSYTSALALNYLADTDPEGVTMGKVNEMLAEMMEDGGGAGKAKKNAIQQYAQAEVADPFAVMKKAQEQGKPKAVPRMPRMFADGGPVNEVGTQAVEVDGYAGGGDVADVAEQMTVGTLPTDQRPAGEVFRGIGRDVVRGAQYLPYDLAGAPVDIATMVMRPFGYDVEKPVGGSEWLIDKAAQAGIADRPTGSTAETATRIGMGFVNPAAVARQIPRGIAALQKGTETLGTGAVRAITGKPEITTEQIYQAMAEPKGIMQLGAPAIVKPKGGTFMSGEFSNFDQALNTMSDSLQGRKQAYQYVQGGEEDIKKIEAVDNFFKSKFKNYYQKKLGSQNDPLREAFIRGDFNGSDWFIAEELAGLREILTDPTTVGSVSRKQALDTLNNKYDAWTDIAAIFPDVNTLDEANNFNMRTKSGNLATSPLNLYPERVLDRLKEQGATAGRNELAYSVDVRPISEFDAKAVNALKEKDLVYDVASVPGLTDRMVSIRDYLMTLNPNQIKNISFEDAIIGAERYHDALNNPAIKFTPAELFEGREKLFQPSKKYQWSEIKTEDALRREGAAMNHCIGGDDYCRQLTSGIGKHFSLQDAKTGIPHTTISIYRSPFAPPNAKHVVVEQIKGNSNSAPTKYFDEVEKFLEDYEKRVGKIYITEDKEHIPSSFRGAEYTQPPRGYEGNQFANGGIVDKPLYDRAA